MKDHTDINKRIRRQCWMSLISAAVVAIDVCIGVTMNLTTLYDVNFDHMGIKTFCMFTVLSNILAGIAMILVIPYAVDGLRTHSYHLPRWIVDLVYVGVTAVALTFLVSLCILAPVKGFKLIFTGSRFFLHGVCPLLAIIAFCFFMTEKEIRLKDSLLPLIPVLLYAAVYYVMVVVIGEDRGGWNDFYGFATRIPVWISALAIGPITFGIASGIRALHNLSFRRRVQEEGAFYDSLFMENDILKVIENMGRVHGMGRDREVIVPAQVLSVMLDHSNSGHSLEECCEAYLKGCTDGNGDRGPDPYWT